MSTLSKMQQAQKQYGEMDQWKWVLCWLFFIGVPYTVLGSTGEAVFAFLPQLKHTNASGIGGAYTAKFSENGELDGIGINPAGIVFSKNKNTVSKKWIAVGLRTGFIQDQVGYLSYSFGLYHWKWAVSLDYVYDGAINKIDEKGILSGEKITPFAGVSSLTLAKELYPNWRWGGSVKIPFQTLGDFEQSQWAFGWAFDMGVQYQPNWNFIQLGVSLLNIGRKETALVQGGDSKEWLPWEGRIGARYRIESVKQGYLSLDYALPLHLAPYIVVGFEKSWSSRFTFRLGTRWSQEELFGIIQKIFFSENTEILGQYDNKFTGGTSLDLEWAWVDYAVLYGLQLGWQHQIGVRWNY